MPAAAPASQGGRLGRRKQRIVEETVLSATPVIYTDTHCCQPFAIVPLGRAVAAPIEPNRSRCAYAGVSTRQTDPTTASTPSSWAILSFVYKLRMEFVAKYIMVS